MSVKLFADDTFPSRLTYSVNKQPVDITGYAFRLAIGYPGEDVLYKDAVILNQTTNKGQFEFRWVSGDLVAGLWPCQIRTTFPDATVKTDDLDALNIVPRI